MPRKTGEERYTYEQDRTKRLIWANRQIKAIMTDIMRLEMTTGTISNFCALPETGNAAQYSSGNRTYGESVLAFANIVRYMQQGAVPELNFSVNDVYDRLTHRGGIRVMKRLLSSLSDCGLEDSELESHYELLQLGLTQMPIHELQAILAPHLRTAMEGIKSDLEARQSQEHHKQGSDVPLAPPAIAAPSPHPAAAAAAGMDEDRGVLTAEGNKMLL